MPSTMLPLSSSGPTRYGDYRRKHARTYSHWATHPTMYFMVVHLGRIVGNRTYKYRMLLPRSSSLIDCFLWKEELHQPPCRDISVFLDYYFKGVSTAGSFPEVKEPFKRLNLVPVARLQVFKKVLLGQSVDVSCCCPCYFKRRAR